MNYNFRISVSSLQLLTATVSFSNLYIFHSSSSLNIPGRDASRAYVTGDFSEAGLVDDISGLSGGDYIGLDEWVKFYDKDYKYVGKYG